MINPNNGRTFKHVEKQQCVTFNKVCRDTYQAEDKN
jgi:hypothetical protein